MNKREKKVSAEEVSRNSEAAHPIIVKLKAQNLALINENNELVSFSVTSIKTTKQKKNARTS